MSKRFKRLKKLSPQPMDILNLSHEGRGIAKVSDKTTFVFNALQGEKVMAKYTSSRNKYDEAEAIDILLPSENRVIPRCPHFGMCGGCQLQHMSHPLQIQIKQQSLLDKLKHIANCQPETILAPLTAEQWGYRRKARLSVRHVHGKGNTLVGFRERKARYVVDMNECHILIPEVGFKIKQLRALITSLEAHQKIAQIEVAKGDNETAFIFRNLIPLSDEDISLLKQFGKEQQAKIYLQPKGPDSIYPIFPENTELLMQYHLDNLVFSFHPSSFIQINKFVNNKMIAQAIDLLELTPSSRVLDLFCGIGNFSLPIAKHCQEVVGIEGSDDAVTLAKKNAQQNGLDNTTFYSANLFEDIQHLPVSKQSFDRIVLDPPRQGAEQVIPLLSTWQATKIVYVSCNPSTFARDTALIIQQGYKLEKLGIMDMFAHTEHIEVIGLFAK